MTPYTGRVSAVATPSHFAPPLQKLLLQVADAVQGVQSGQSLNELLARCPAELRPGTQALTFHVLRHLGAAQAARKLLAPKAPPAKVDSLLLSALALLWPVAEPAYADHTVVDQTVSAARKRAAPSAGFINAVLRRFLREREALVAAAQRDPQGAFNHPPWWIEKLKADWPAEWQAILSANNAQPPMSLRAHAGRGTAAGLCPAPGRGRPGRESAGRSGAAGRGAGQAGARDCNCRALPRATSRCRTPPPSWPRPCF